MDLLTFLGGLIVHNETMTETKIKIDILSYKIIVSSFHCIMLHALFFFDLDSSGSFTADREVAT